MDLAKAKVVIIALLLALNIFLLYNNVSYYMGSGVLKETIRNTETILKARGISLDCEIPAKTYNIRELIYGKKILDRSNIVKRFIGLSAEKTDNGDSFHNAGKKLIFTGKTGFVFSDSAPGSPVNLNNTNEAVKFARTYLEEASLIDNNYILDSVDNNQDGNTEVCFIEKYDNYLIFDNYCKVILTSKGVSGLEYNKLQIKGFVPGKSNSKSTAYQVLLTGYGKADGKVITSIDIGYNNPGSQSVKESKIMPVWRVKIKGKTEPDYLSTVKTE